MNAEQGYFHCFGCGAGGDVITFIRKIENLDYIDAVKFLAQRAGMELPEDGRDEAAAVRVLEDAQAIEAAGASLLVLEAIPAPLAERISAVPARPRTRPSRNPGRTRAPRFRTSRAASLPRPRRAGSPPSARHATPWSFHCAGPSAARTNLRA